MSWLLVPLLKNAILVVPLALVALAAGRWSRRPALVHLLWVLVLIKLLTPPLIDVPLGWRLDVESWLGLKQEEPEPGQAAVASRIAPAGKGVQAARQAPRASRRRPDASFSAAPATAASTDNKSSWSALLPSGPRRLQLLAAIWLGGSVLVALHLAWRAWRFHGYLCRAARPHETLGPRVGELAQEARIGISPQVVVIEGVMSPALWTLGRRACLIFPARLAERLAPAELDALLLHELSHFARGDHWVRVLELAGQVLSGGIPSFGSLAASWKLLRSSAATPGSSSTSGPAAIRMRRRCWPPSIFCTTPRTCRRSPAGWVKCRYCGPG